MLMKNRLLMYASNYFHSSISLRPTKPPPIARPAVVFIDTPRTPAD